MPGSTQDRRISSGLAWTITIACAIFVIHHLVRSRDMQSAEVNTPTPHSFHQQQPSSSPAAKSSSSAAVDEPRDGTQRQSGDYLRRMKDMVDGIRKELRGYSDTTAVEQVQKLESLQKYLEGATADPILEFSQPSTKAKSTATPQPATSELSSAQQSPPPDSSEASAVPSDPDPLREPGATSQLGVAPTAAARAPSPDSGSLSSPQEPRPTADTPSAAISSTTGTPSLSFASPSSPQADQSPSPSSSLGAPPPSSTPSADSSSTSTPQPAAGAATLEQPPGAEEGSIAPIVPKVIEPDPAPSQQGGRVKLDCASLPQDCPHHRECRFGSAKFTESERKQIVLNILRAFVNSTFYQKEWFWLHGGTLLGSHRNGRFIQWDDDADLSTTWQSFARILEITGGYDTRFGPDDRFMISVECHYPDIPARVVDTHNGFYVDIFVFYDKSTFQEVKLKNYQNTRKTPLGPDDFHNPFPFNNGCTHYKRHELFPLRTCRLEGIELSCPKNTEAFLRRCYGPSWKIPKRWH